MTNTVQSKSFQILIPMLIIVFCLAQSLPAYSVEDVETQSSWEEKFIKGNIAVSNFFDSIAF